MRKTRKITFEKTACSLRFLAATATTVALLMVGTQTALAHKVNLFATAEGETISGYAYYSGGARPRNMTIAVLGPGEKKLAEIQTNERGEFTYRAVAKCDHTLVLKLEDGHEAEFTVKAAELPDSLPAPGGAEATPAGGKSEPVAGGETTVAPRVDEGVLPASLAEVEAIVSKAVSQQIRPLREHLDAYQEEAKLHDILGGIGYIVGLSGVAFYFLGARRNERRAGAGKTANE